MHLQPNRVRDVDVVIACCVLHNFLRSKAADRPFSADDIDTATACKPCAERPHSR